MQKVIITYNNQVIPSPTPLVTLSTDNIYYNQYWGKTDQIILEGQISGSNGCSPFSGIISGQNNLLNIFNKNFGNLEIYEGADGNFFTGLFINRMIITGCNPITSNGTYDRIYLPESKETGTFTGRNGNNIRYQINTGWILYDALYFGNKNTFTNEFLNPYTWVPSGGVSFGTAEVLYLSYDNIYTKSGIIVKSISFDQSNYAGIINYNIELNSTSISGNIIEPANEYSFTENEDKSISLSHNVSAKGINTSQAPYKSNAIDNAISFVRNCTGLINVPTTKFISGNNNKFYLQNFSESIDRLNAVYSIQENYTSNLLNGKFSGNLNYALDINSGADSNIIEINIKGDYKGPKGGDINNLRNTLDVTGLISGLYSGYFNKVPVQYNITENIAQNLINFNYSFDNVDFPNPYYKYQSSISRDELQQVYNIQIQGDILTRGNRAHRYYLANANLINLTGQFLNVASGILTGFKDFNQDSNASTLRLLNISIQRDPNKGTVSATANYDDKFMPTDIFVDATYNVNVDAPHWYMNNQPTCNIKGYHIINDFDITTLPKLGLSTSFKYKDITGSNNELSLRQTAKSLTEQLTPLNYDFAVKLQDSESFVKKYNNFTSTTDISYKLDKTSLTNQNGLLPKFNTI
jgi:hypothetical protein